MVLKVFDDTSLIRYICGDDSYIIKYYNSRCERINNYLIMEKYGIGTEWYCVKSDKIIIFKDIEDSLMYRFVKEDDLANEKVIEKLANLYKKLHSFSDDNCFDYLSCFTKGNLVKIINKFKFDSDKTFLYIYNNFDNIKLKCERAYKCFVNGGFSLEKLVVSNDFEEIFFIDFDDLGNGNRCMDLNELFEKFDSKNKDLFLKCYGDVKVEEFIINSVVSSFYALYLATINGKLDYGVRCVLDDIRSGKLYETVTGLVNWY